MDDRTSIRRYVVHGACTTQLPLRVLNLFAQQGMIVEQFTVFRVDDCYSITLDVAAFSEQSVLIILEKLRGMVLVEDAQCEAV